MEGLGHTKKNNKQRIVVCAQNSELFEHCVRWLKSFFIESHQANTVEYEFCFVSVIPQNKGDVCGVMAQGLGVPASLADCERAEDGSDPVVVRERRLIGALAKGLNGTVYILRHGHGDHVDAESVGEAVCTFCTTMDADMVVVSQYRVTETRRDEELRHVFQGSVVKYLLQHCPRPVLMYME
jgi:hypothetical protein